MSSKIKKIKIKDIKPASYNPRTITDETKESLQNSIDEFGLVDPIIINLKTNNIIGGHQRFNYLYSKDSDQELSLLELGDIGWVYLDEDLEIKDAEHEKALNIALNKISADWNINSLNNLLDELKSYELDGLTGFDYSLDDFDYEYIPIDEDDDEYEDDDYEEPSIDNSVKLDTPIIETKDKQVTEKKGIVIPKDTIYKLNNNLIYYGELTKNNEDKAINSYQFTNNILNNDELKLIESSQITINYYITDSENLIRRIIQNPNIERIR